MTRRNTVSAPLPPGLMLGLGLLQTVGLGLGLGNKQESTSKKVFLYRSKSSTIKAPWKLVLINQIDILIKPTTPKVHVLKLCLVCHLLVGRRLTIGFAQYIRGPGYLQVIQSDWPSGQLSSGDRRLSANQRPGQAELTNERPGACVQP